MAAICRIADNSGTPIIDLISGVFTIKRGSWRTQVRDGLVDEIITLVSKDTDANIIEADFAWEELGTQVDLYLDNPHDNKPIWFYNYADGEDSKRSLIYGVSLTPISYVDSHQLLGGFGAYRSLIITHHISYEPLTPMTIPGSSMAYTAANIYLNLAHHASRNARISKLTLLREVTDYGDPLYRMWVGIREFNIGTSGFRPLIECETTANGGAGSLLATAYDTADVNDTSCSNDYKAQCTFATVATLAKRVTIRLDGIAGATTSHFVGKYIALLRCKLTNVDTVVRLQAKSGFYGSADALQVQVGDDIYIDGETSWKHIELGNISIPPFPLPGGTLSISLDKFIIQILAERITGTGYLEMDSIVLIPSRRLCFLEGGNVRYVSTYENPMYIMTTERDEIIAYAEQEGSPMNNVVASLSGEAWDLPPDIKGDPIAVFVFEGEDAHSVDDTATVEIEVYKRYNYRHGYDI